MRSKSSPPAQSLEVVRARGTLTQWRGRRSSRPQSTHKVWSREDGPRQEIIGIFQKLNESPTRFYNILTSVKNLSQFLILDLAISLMALFWPVCLCSPILTTPYVPLPSSYHSRSLMSLTYLFLIVFVHLIDISGVLLDHRRLVDD